ncbi:MAG: glycosyltransferase family 39 protein [Candidatus Azobacteroides sp.]|nr:glycosyltransferase family 39 protein [Candidatus Azobacteroides sp.]
MRPPSLQRFYLEKPAVLLTTITLLSVFLWIGYGDFYTKGEPREASVAVSMIEKDQWILPEVYADEIAYKPPLMHWLTAVFSLPGGKVTPLSARLPSALAFLGLVVFSFMFFGRNLRVQEAFLAALILLTCFETHRAAMTARVDMLLTFLIVWALIRLFRWEEEKKLNGFPWLIPVIMSLAVLTKGPVGIVLPLLVFGIYLLLLRYNFWKIAGKLILLGLSALILPLIWYILAYQKGGEGFMQLVLAENFGRFFAIDNLNISYDLGHKEGWWYNWISLAGGFIPWTLLLIISLFCLSYKRFPGIRSVWNSFLQLEKTKFFSIIAALVIIVFYSIPMSKRSVYLMPAYPFISIFIAQYVLYLTEYKEKVVRIFAGLIGIIACLAGLIVLLTVTIHWINPINLLSSAMKNTDRLAQFSAIWQSAHFSQLGSEFLLIILFFSIYVLFNSFRKKLYLKTLYSILGVCLSLLLVMDGLIFPAYKNAISVRPIAKNIATHYPLTNNNLFVMNNLLEYDNMYGLNFYLHNYFRNFEKELPSKGYFLTGATDFEKVLQKYKTSYNFDLLKEYPNYSRDGERIIQIYFFKKK